VLNADSQSTAVAEASRRPETRIKRGIHERPSFHQLQPPR
jgi:hypothetical protein